MWKLRGTISTFNGIKCIWKAIWKTLKWEFLLPVTQIIISKKLFYCTKVGNILLKAIKNRSRKKGMFPMKLLKPCRALFETFLLCSNWRSNLEWTIQRDTNNIWHKRQNENKRNQRLHTEKSKDEHHEPTKKSGHISTGCGKEKTQTNLQKTLASHFSISIIICKQQKECRSPVSCLNALLELY
jgi:hypothetical protein